MTDSTTSAPQLLLAREVARMLSISERSVWAITAPRGPLRAVRIGKLCRYDRADVLAFIESAKGVRP